MGAGSASFIEKKDSPEDTQNQNLIQLEKQLTTLEDENIHLQERIYQFFDIAIKYKILIVEELEEKFDFLFDHHREFLNALLNTLIESETLEEYDLYCKELREYSRKIFSDTENFVPSFEGSLSENKHRIEELLVKLTDVFSALLKTQRQHTFGAIRKEVASIVTATTYAPVHSRFLVSAAWWLWGVLLGREKIKICFHPRHDPLEVAHANIRTFTPEKDQVFVQMNHKPSIWERHKNKIRLLVVGLVVGLCFAFPPASVLGGAFIGLGVYSLIKSTISNIQTERLRSQNIRIRKEYIANIKKHYSEECDYQKSLGEHSFSQYDLGQASTPRSTTSLLFSRGVTALDPLSVPPELSAQEYKRRSSIPLSPDRHRSEKSFETTNILPPSEKDQPSITSDESYRRGLTFLKMEENPYSAMKTLFGSQESTEIGLNYFPQAMPSPIKVEV